MIAEKSMQRRKHLTVYFITEILNMKKQNIIFF